jgi:hypothetical protein
VEEKMAPQNSLHARYKNYSYPLNQGMKSFESGAPFSIVFKSGMSYRQRKQIEWAAMDTPIPSGGIVESVLNAFTLVLSSPWIILIGTFAEFAQEKDWTVSCSGDFEVLYLPPTLALNEP